MSPVRLAVPPFPLNGFPFHAVRIGLAARYGGQTSGPDGPRAAGRIDGAPALRMEPAASAPPPPMG